MFINGFDAYNAWGVSMDSSALSQIMTPAPLKEQIENRSALENGKRVFRSGRKLDERTVTVTFNISAVNESQFLDRYGRFCSDVLAIGVLDITTKYQPGVVYKFDYLSCQSFSEFRLGVGKFVLRMSEANPADRSAQ